MKTVRFTLFALTLCFAFSVGLSQAIGQTKSSSISAFSDDDWLGMIQDPDVNFYKAQDAFYKFWEGRTDYKGNGWKVFKRWEYINESRVLPDGKLQAPAYVRGEYLKYMDVIDETKSIAGNWTIVGPTAYPTNNTSQPTGMGRVNAIAFHPTNANIIFIGAPSGGFWKTTDGGSNWTNLSSDLPTLGVSSILVDPVDPDIIYLGSGDRDSDDAQELGVFKTIDGGLTWDQMNSTMGDVVVGAMVMHPTDEDIIIAATSGGIYKTTNGAQTWTLRSGSDNFKDIKFKPGDPTIVYAVDYSSANGAKFYRSTNTGDSWTEITSGILNAGTAAAGARMVIGVSPANSSFVYLFQIHETTKVFQALLRSTDSGLSFTTQSTSPNIMDYACDGSGTASQATYDLCIAVDPTDADIVFVGGINIWKSSDGGVNWTINTHWVGSSYSEPCAPSVHADHHVFEWSPINDNLYVGHDGGISYTANDGASWTEITNNLAITQIYKIGQGASNTNYTLFGCQDNGSAATTDGSTFTTTRGGDGTECIIDYSNSNYCYNTYIKGDIKRSTTGPNGTYTEIAATGSNGIGADETGAWVTPYMLHETNASVMFAGYENVFRCDDVKASPASSVSWSAISTGETTTCSVLEQSPADLDIIYVVRSGSMKRTDNVNVTPASVSWTACALPGNDTPTDLEAHPTNANIVYTTVDYGIYKSTDKGATWTDISGNLPSLFINCLVYDKNSDEGLYVGNQTAVWYKDSDMTDWMLFSEGLPPVDIRELEIFYDPVGTQDRIKAGSYGRGLWESDLYESGVLNPLNFTADAISENQINTGWSLNPSNNNVVLAFNTSSTFGTPVNGTTYSASSTISGGGTVLYNGSATSLNHTSLSALTPYYYKLWSYDGSTEYSTETTANATTDCPTVKILPFTEDFEGVTFPPQCWLVFSGENNLGTSNEWIRTTTNTYLSSAGSAFAEYENVSGGLAEDWMVTPGILLPPSGTTTLNFYERQSYSTDYGSMYYIKVSTDSQDSHVDFTNVTSYDETTFGITYTQRSIDLSSKNGQLVYVAFVMSNDNGDDWYIDNINITNTSNFWTGDTDSDWNTLSNWSESEVPSGSSNLVIPDVVNQPIISTGNSGLANDLTIHSEVALTVKPTASLTVNGTLTNDAGDSGLVIESDATGTGTLLHGTADVAASVERYVAKYNDVNDQMYHFISSPVEAQAIQPGFVTAPPKANYDFMAWDEPGYQWVNSKTVSDIWNDAFEDNFIIGKGYLVAWPTNETKTFTGELNSYTDASPLVITCSNTNSGGWNLLGNPFPSSIDWDLVDKGDGMDNALYYYDNTNENYKYYIQLGGYGVGGGSQYIPPMQGFMAHAKTTGTKTLLLDNTQRTHLSSDIYYKSEVPNLFTLQLEGNNKTDEAVIFFYPSASTGFDSHADAYKLFSSSATMPQVYSITTTGTKLAINTFPDLSANPDVPIGVRIPVVGSYSLKASGLETFSDASEISLHDNQTGTNHSFNVSSVYPFETNVSGEINDRFELRFKGETGISKLSENIAVYYSQGYIRINIPEEIAGQLTISNILGQSVFNRNMNIQKETVIPVHKLMPGAYFVRITDGKQIMNKKFIVF